MEYIRSPMAAPVSRLIACYTGQICDESVEEEGDVAHYRYVAQSVGCTAPRAAGMFPKQAALIEDSSSDCSAPVNMKLERFPP